MCVSRFGSVEEFAALDQDDLHELAAAACRLAVEATGVGAEATLDTLRMAEEGRSDPAAATSLRGDADRLDEDAWGAQEAGDAHG